MNTNGVIEIMSGLNLSPNPVVLLVQSGLFLTGLVIVKKLFVVPFMKIKKHREHLTIGTKSDIQTIQLKNEIDQKSLIDKLAQAKLEALSDGNRIRQKAFVERGRIVEAAQLESKRILTEFEAKLDKALNVEAEKLPKVVAEVARSCFEVTIQ